MLYEKHLTHIDRSSNRFRFYRIQVWPDLFGHAVVVREWGRIGHPGTLRYAVYTDHAAANAASARLAARKQRKGYRPI